MHFGVLVLGAVAFALWRESVIESAATKGMRDLITRVARQQGVPVRVALAFAWIESKLQPQLEGDKRWPFKKPQKYRELVLDAPRFKDNPWRTDASRWHSYGLFQLLAPYHTLPTEDPRALLNPQVNAERGIAQIKRLLAKHNGNVQAARLAYIGCGPDGEQCSDVDEANALRKLEQALERFQGAA